MQLEAVECPATDRAEMRDMETLDGTLELCRDGYHPLFEYWHAEYAETA